MPSGTSGLTATSPKTPPCPASARPQPDPPTPHQAARLLNLVFEEDEEFGLYLWTSFPPAAGAAKWLAFRENRLDFDLQEVRFAKNYIVKRGKRIEKAPKDGEGRLVFPDPLTCELNRGYFTRRRASANAIGVDVPEDAYAYSPDPAGREPWNPDTMTHRYRRYADKVGIRSSLKELRHYSATQLLASGVDLNTVAGQASANAEGSTTLKFYAKSRVLHQPGEKPQVTRSLQHRNDVSDLKAVAV